MGAAGSVPAADLERGNGGGSCEIAAPGLAAPPTCAYNCAVPTAQTAPRGAAPPAPDAEASVHPVCRICLGCEARGASAAGGADAAEPDQA